MPAVAFTPASGVLTVAVTETGAKAGGPTVAVQDVFGAVTMGAVSVTGAGNVARPAWPTSCCSSSVAPRTPLCISVRFQMVCWWFVICSNAVVTMLDTASSRPVATRTSTSEKPASERSLVIMARTSRPSAPTPSTWEA